MTILWRKTGWWYWAAIEALLIAGLAGWFEAFWLALALSFAQIAHFRLRESSFAAFPVQVRLAYSGVLALALWEPLLFWLPAAGTLALVLFGYCAIARTLSLLPWNRSQPMSWRLVWRTFMAPPVRGNVMQGLA